MTTIWGLIDDRTGHTGQVLGVIGKLGVPYVLKRLEYNALGNLLPPSLLGATMMQLNKEMSAPLEPPYPPLVIASGRRTLPVLRAIKKASPHHQNHLPDVARSAARCRSYRGARA